MESRKGLFAQTPFINKEEENIGKWTRCLTTIKEQSSFEVKSFVYTRQCPCDKSWSVKITQISQ